MNKKKEESACEVRCAKRGLIEDDIRFEELVFGLVHWNSVELVHASKAYVY